MFIVTSGILWFFDRASSCIPGKWPAWRTVFYMLCLFRSSTCFEQSRAHPQEDNCVNRTSGIITLCWVSAVPSRPAYRPDTSSECCINTIVLLRMSTRLLETYWRSKYFFFNVCHPEVFNTCINRQWCISQTQQNFIMFITVLGQHVSTLIESVS